MTELNLYRRLFIHREDAYARQYEDGHYEPVRTALDDVALMAHLDGFASYGCYVIRPEDNTVSAIVFDLDTYNNQALDFLTRVVTGLVRKTVNDAQASCPCLLLEDSGGKGYHVWLFLTEPIAARKARMWASAVGDAYASMRRTAAEWPALEIFPKQDVVEEGGYGNLVKLPLGVHAVTHARSEWRIHRGWATSPETVTPLDVALIPEPTERVRRTPSAQAGRTQFACVNAILEGMPSANGHNRDNSLYFFARYARSCGLPEDLLAEWVERVNDSFNPPLTTRELRVKVQSALRAQAPHPSCREDWLGGFCPGSDTQRNCPNYRGEQTSTATHDDVAMLTPEERAARRRKEEGQ